MDIFQTGNTFNTRRFKQGHARKVWREMRLRLPAGGKVLNITDWVSKGKIPAGTPAKYEVDPDTGAKKITCYTNEQVKAATAGESAAGVASLGIKGNIQEDIPIANGETVGTATVIYDGELYEYMLDPDVAAALKAIADNDYRVLLVQ